MRSAIHAAKSELTMYQHCEVRFTRWERENIAFAHQRSRKDLQRSVPQNGRVHLLVIERSVLLHDPLGVHQKLRPGLGGEVARDVL